MGGHDHHVKTPPVPDASIYKVEDSARWTKVQQRLAVHGLKDPWARNHVWRCHLNKGYKNPHWVLLRLLTWGWQYWVPLVGLTVGVEHFLGIDYHAHGHHNHDENHEEPHH